MYNLQGKEDFCHVFFIFLIFLKNNIIMSITAGKPANHAGPRVLLRKISTEYEVLYVCMYSRIVCNVVMYTQQ